MIQVTLLDLTKWSRVGQWFHVNQLPVQQFVYITYRMHCCALYSHTHTHTHMHMHTHMYTHTHVRTHRHTYTHTRARTRAYSTGKCIKASTNMHSKHALWYNMCMTSQIVWYNSKSGRIQGKKNVCTVCLCLCYHAWVKLCVLILAVWAYVVALLWHVVSWLVTEDSK